MAVSAFAGFVVVEGRLSMGAAHQEAGADSPRPLLDLSWFRRPEFCGANAGAGLMNLGTLGGLFALGLYLQQGEGLSLSKPGSPLCRSPSPSPP